MLFINIGSSLNYSLRIIHEESLHSKLILITHAYYNTIAMFTLIINIYYSNAEKKKLRLLTVIINLSSNHFK